jgi:arabinogalactan endo-1,4-beta-galactosidase
MSRLAATVLKRLSVGFAALLVAALVTPSANAAPPAVPAAGYGFGDGAQMTWLGSADVNRELDAVAKTSATWLRVLIPWTKVEPAKGQYDWGQTDLVINAATARGLKVLGVIAFSPDWARPGGSYFTAPPNDVADYADFSTAVVNRYGGSVSSWQLWNEPNLPLFFGFTPHNAPRYTELVRAAYPAIKAVQPNSTVVLAGLSRLPGDESPPAFMEKMYAAGAKGSFDAAAAHPYVFPSGLAANQENGFSDLAAVHGVMAANGDGGKRIWITELGAPTSEDRDGVSQEEQAKQITDVLSAVAATSYSGPAFIYSIRDTDTANRGDRESNFGALLTSDWQPKVTAGVLAR